MLDNPRNTVAGLGPAPPEGDAAVSVALAPPIAEQPALEPKPPMAVSGAGVAYVTRYRGRTVRISRAVDLVAGVSRFVKPTIQQAADLYGVSARDVSLIAHADPVAREAFDRGAVSTRDLRAMNRKQAAAKLLHQYVVRNTIDIDLVVAEFGVERVARAVERVRMTAVSANSMAAE
jgi:hypothetical protein